MRVQMVRVKFFALGAILVIAGCAATSSSIGVGVGRGGPVTSTADARVSASASMEGPIDSLFGWPGAWWQWRRAKFVNATEGYESYLLKHPDAWIFSDRARSRVEEHYWAQAELSDSVAGYEIFVARQPNSTHTPEAQARLRRLYWTQAQAADDIRGYETYLLKQPAGEHADDAGSRLEVLYLARATEANTAEAYQEFIEKQPDSQFVAQARSRVEELDIMRVESADDAEAYEAFIRDRPDSPFAEQARMRLEQLSWMDTVRDDSIQSYDRFLRVHSNSIFAEQARRNIELLKWQQAELRGRVQDYESFLAQHPDSPYADPARARLEQKSWDHVQAAYSVQSHMDFLRRFPESPRADEARRQIEALTLDLRNWEAVRNVGTVDAYRGFAAGNPDSIYSVKARALITEFEADGTGRNVFELLRTKKIEVEAFGNGMLSVALRIGRLVDRPVTVVIPAGTFFFSDTNAQNMVVRREARIELPGHETETVAVDAIGVDWSRRPADSRDRLDIQPIVDRDEIDGFIPILAQAGSSHAVDQAAIWILSDGSDFTDLGLLVEQAPGEGGVRRRMIQADDAVRAMKILHDARIKVTRLRIWNDYDLILQSLKDAELRAWLVELKGSDQGPRLERTWH